MDLFDSDPRLQSKPFICWAFLRVVGLSFTGIFTCLAVRSEIGFCPDTARAVLANVANAPACTLKTMSDAMKQTFGLVRRPWGVFYLKNKSTGSNQP
jgi:hypothetical protein